MLTLLLYLCAGYMISDLVIEATENNYPDFFPEYHKELNPPWSLETTRGVLKFVLVVCWITLPFFNFYRNRK